MLRFGLKFGSGALIVMVLLLASLYSLSRFGSDSGSDFKMFGFTSAALLESLRVLLGLDLALFGLCCLLA